ncbi:MAG TPA: TadE/TadG family type IV pilus assembly protein [Roseiflexaceae bacterium]|nr:TadE/TadG family type IV pilus assembly protein [Roseiflexaceae bacterium]
MQRRHLPHSPGQSLVVFALAAIVIFGMIGLGIDGGIMYMQRRLMQNTADAACLAAVNRMALGRLDSEARAAAIDVITRNLGATPGAGANAPGTLAFTTVAELYNNGVNVGSGTGLTHGIEIAETDVRVALRSPANALFLGVLGFQRYTVGARAHCNSTAGGGASPFAVSRWRAYESSTSDTQLAGLTTEEPLPQTYGPHDEDVMYVRDLLAQADRSYLSAWPWDLTADPSDYPGDPAARTGMYASPAYPASRANKGFDTVLAGDGASPNGGDPSFRGAVVLDFRQITFTPPLYYNGLQPDSSLNVYKDYATRWITSGYPGPDVIPGQQLGFYNGVTAGQIVHPFDDRYDVGDIVTTLVYNGTTYYDPLFTTDHVGGDRAETRSSDSLSGICASEIPSGEAFDGNSDDPSDRKDPASYGIEVTPDTSSYFKARSFLSSGGASYGDAEAQWDGAGWGSFNDYGIGPASATVNIQGSSTRAFTFEVQPSDSFTCSDGTDIPLRENGAQSIYLEVQDTVTSRRRGRYVFLDQSASTNDFYAYIPDELVYTPAEPGTTLDPILRVETVGGTRLNARDLAPVFQWFDATSMAPIGAPSDITTEITNAGGGGGGGNRIKIRVGRNAVVNKEYYLRTQLSRTVSGSTYTHWVWYYVQVRVPVSASDSTLKNFVYALGYANFEVTYIDANTIRGRAVSGLLTPEEVMRGLQPRLIPW